MALLPPTNGILIPCPHCGEPIDQSALEWLGKDFAMPDPYKDTRSSSLMEALAEDYRADVEQHQHAQPEQ